MSLVQFLIIIRARFVVMVIIVTLCVSASVALSLILPKQYQSTASLIFNVKGVDTMTGLNLPVNFLQAKYLQTQMTVIRSHKVAKKVVDKLNLHLNPTYVSRFTEQVRSGADIRTMVAEDLIDNLAVMPRNNIVVIQFTSISPEFSTIVANSFADAYLETNIELKVEPAQKATEWFKDQVASLRNQVEIAQARLTEYETEKGLLFSDSRFDIETERLTQLTTTLIEYEDKLFDLEAKLAAVNKTNIEAVDIDMLDNDTFNELKIKITQLESKFAETQQRLSVNHPEYRAVAAELSAVKDRLEKELELLKTKLNEDVILERLRVDQLITKIESQKSKLTSLNKDRDNKDVYERDVQMAKQILSGTMARMNQISMEGSFEQTDVAILNEAVIPITHSKPIFFINVLISIALGGILALVTAFILEFTNRKVRSKDDFSDPIDIPVLLEFKKIKPSR